MQEGTALTVINLRYLLVEEHRPASRPPLPIWSFGQTKLWDLEWVSEQGLECLKSRSTRLLIIGFIKFIVTIEVQAENERPLSV
jgi:hypothetical protein